MAQLSYLRSIHQIIGYAGLITMVASLQVILVNLDATALAVQAPSTLGLLVFVIIAGWGVRALSNRFPRAAYLLQIPVQRLMLKMLPGRGRLQRIPEPIDTPSALNDSNGSEALIPPPVVITEEAQAKLDLRERSMIRSILKMDEASVKSVMVPRIDIIAVEVESPLSDVAAKMLEHGHSRLPVYEETIDQVLGVVYSRDLLRYLVAPEESPSLLSIIKPAYFIPESKLLDDLLRELQDKHLQMAIVVDEYGGVEGLLTLEDLIEEIVGEIEDEFSRSMEPRVVPLPNGEIVVDARVTINYISDLMATTINHDDVDTVGGLVYSSLGKMPEVGDQVMLDGLTIEVISLFGRRINKLKLTRSLSARN
ncbi:MAG: HlyC/CorC family transporter [Dehalococcoidia bacterium]|nr:HlyC/CorC family transporter [Dehalococcoidia bacterium]